MKNTIISKFKNYKSTNPENVILWDWLNDNSYKSDVEYIRAIDDKTEINRLKSNLPTIAPSGTFSKRGSSYLIKHSGFICIDIDSGDNPSITDFKDLRNQLSNILNVAYSGLSVSGKGVFCLIPILHTNKHKEHFEALKICFEKLDIIIDKACSDVSRLRGYSYDEDAYFNENAIVFNQVFEYKFDTSKLPENKIIQRDYKNENNTYARVMKIATQINNCNIDITKEYIQWFQVGCSLANEFGEEGREIFHLVSQNHPKYHPETCDRKYSECLRGGYTDISIGTFFHWAKEYGIS
jgi:hypothetical protein